VGWIVSTTKMEQKRQVTGVARLKKLGSDSKKGIDKNRDANLKKRSGKKSDSNQRMNNHNRTFGGEAHGEGRTKRKGGF